MMGKGAELLEQMRGAPLLRSFVDPPRVPVSLGLYGNRITLAELASLPDGGPCLRAFAEASLAGHRTPPSITQPNLENPAAVAGLAGRLITESGIQTSYCNLVLPDRAARVVLLPVDDLPSRRSDQDQLLRWRLRKTTPFPIDDARLDWSAWHNRTGHGATVFAVAIRNEVLRQYESVVEALDIRAATVTLESFALADFAGENSRDGDWAILHVSEEGFIFQIFRGDRPAFYRCKTYRKPPQDVPAAFFQELVPSMEYYRSRLSGSGLRTLHVAGPFSDNDALLRKVQEAAGAPPTTLDPSDALLIPPDLGLDDAARLRMASCLGPAVRGWNS